MWKGEADGILVNGPTYLRPSIWSYDQTLFHK